VSAESPAATEVDVVERMRVQYEVEQFLYREAQLLDERRYGDWLELFSLDVIYRAPVRVTREGLDDVVDDNGLCIFDDDYGQLELRVQGVQVKSAWAEIPPSRSRRTISCVQVEPLENGDLRARSNFIVYRTRAENIEHWFVGTRVDVLRRRGESFQIMRRDILFDTVAFATDNISLLF
jgi:3-phenylpropionate/cinnamic acid dioxygenase small subunit